MSVHEHCGFTFIHPRGAVLPTTTTSSVTEPGTRFLPHTLLPLVLHVVQLLHLNMEEIRHNFCVDATLLSHDAYASNYTSRHKHINKLLNKLAGTATECVMPQSETLRETQT